MKVDTNPRNTRCKKPIITGLSPNTASPMDLKIVRLCKNIFKMNAPADIKMVFLTTDPVNRESLKMENDEMMNQLTVKKTEILPIIAITRNKVLGSCQRNERNKDGIIDKQSKTEKK